MNETHLGDGVYVTLEHGQFWLDCRAQEYLSIGPSGTPSICLEPQVLDALNEFARVARHVDADLTN